MAPRESHQFAIEPEVVAIVERRVLAVQEAEVDQEVVDKWNEMYSDGSGISSLIFKLTEGNVVIVDKVVWGDANYEDNSKGNFDKLVAEIRVATNGYAECRYAAIDFKYNTMDDDEVVRKSTKMMFVVVPRGADPNAKVRYRHNAGLFHNRLGTNLDEVRTIRAENELRHDVYVNSFRR